ncbi:response regulator transcription factor [Streptomyces sp. NBC_01476]|uniref:response regulator transcription factor n=1 Tax=Streptomyces sp. NBC_01476 TaxID=2903881 RepID=UPI002E33A608|nr:response regulator transcription factor [Streptomyces sp. NBC_01476]
MHVLVVDSDEAAATLLAERLVRHGYRVSRATTGREALTACGEADIVLLDLALSDLDGLEVCGRIRNWSSTPVITFTSGETELDRVLSLQAGADDCLIKPYSHRELVARMHAVMRRMTRPADSSVLTRGSLRIDPQGRQVRVGDRTVPVTRKEFDLLYLLASVPQTVVSRRDLMTKIWADEWAASSRTVDTHVSSLRNKLGSRDWIVTIRGIGYRLGDALER